MKITFALLLIALCFTCILFIVDANQEVQDGTYNANAGAPLRRMKRTLTRKTWSTIRKLLPPFRWPRINRLRLNVAAIEHEPWISHVSNPDPGRPQYKGFLVDLLDIMSRRLRFLPVYKNNTNNTPWTLDAAVQSISTRLSQDTGDEHIDLIATPLTMTKELHAKANFLHPFEHVGLTVVMKQELTAYEAHEVWNSGFGMFYPVEASVWAISWLALVVVATMLWGMNKFNPYEWETRHNLGRAEENEAQSFNWSGALWFVLSAAHIQGYDRSPRSIASRILMVSWFIYVALMVVMYTSSLINHMFWVNAARSEKITRAAHKSLEDAILAENFHVGVVKNSEAHKYLMTAPGEEFDKLRQNWEKENSVLFSSTQDALNKALGSNSAVILESPVADYYLNKIPYCSLVKVGTDFAQRSYGLAIRKDIEVQTMSWDAVLLSLEESGHMDRLREKWLIGSKQCYNVSSKLDSILLGDNEVDLSKTRDIDMHAFWGPFLYLFLGTLASVLVAASEIYYFKRIGKYDDKNRPVGQHLKMEDDQGHM